MQSRRSSPRRLALLAAFASAAILAGCADYVNHRDTITLAAGDAAKFNNAVHTINPSPPWSHNDNIDMDGQRAAVVIERYGNPPQQPIPSPAPDVEGGS